MIHYLTNIQAPKIKEEKKQTNQNKKPVSFVCLACKQEEDIPYEVVREIDQMDGGDPTVPPQFTCEHSGGVMHPVYYKGISGIEYKIEDVNLN
jgi:hypothetical protein